MTLAHPTLFAFEVWVKGREQFAETINAHSAGAARYDYFLDCRESFPDLSIVDMRSRRIGAPRTPEGFDRVAAYRGRPDLRVGSRVTALGMNGVIVGHNASANFDVLFDSGHRGNLHPDDIQPVAEEAAP